MGAAANDLHALRADALKQQGRVDCLLAIRRRFGVLPAREQAKAACVKWSPDLTDPEFKKNLRIFGHLIEEAVAICERQPVPRTSDASAPAGHLMRARQRVGKLLLRHERTPTARLDELIKLPSGCPLTLKALLGRRFELERCLIEVGDEEYLRSRAADFYTEGPSTTVTWQRLVKEGVLSGPPPLLADVMPQAPNFRLPEGRAIRPRPREQKCRVEQTRRMLEVLVAAKEAEDLPRRGRWELKQQALRVAVPVIALATVLLGLAIAIVEDEVSEVLLPAAAGAAGAALGGLLRLRDELNLGAQIREFRAFFIGQVVVGAAAGLLVFLVVRGEILRPTGGVSGLAALAFAAGFSEAAFLGLIRRLGETVGGRPSA